MGLLDDLKQEASKRKQEEQDALSQEAARKHRYETALKPTLKRLYAYLSELTEQLNLLQPEVAAHYVLPNHGLLSGLSQGGYTTRIDSLDATKKVSFQCQCSLPDALKFAVTPHAEASNTREFLVKQRFQFSDWPIKDSQQNTIGLHFEAQIRIEILLVFAADIANGRILIKGINFHQFGSLTDSLKPEHVDDGWLDNLGRYILGKSDSLQTLEISDIDRQRIREAVRLAAEQRQQYASEPPQTEAPSASPVGGLLDRFRKGLFKA